MSIRLLVNENFPAPSTEALRKAGFDVLDIATHSRGLGDVEVLALAVQAQRWLVTFDRDYGELLFKRRHPPPPAVMLLRVRSYRPHEPAEWIKRWASDAAAHLGTFSVFDGRTIRRRSLLR